ncbi:glycerophosphodiester phosphodiesterase [Gimesia chilikensis]|uniref:glycerophosphodiester phosphodiesterase family protein n=1 Tax=Gimesia chilikensis TaxID=2605989 RepID=UPI0011EF3A73|nr:glycerophosphodiester phosphodiesterase family protein [Gimesia chilikensis]KAA0141580.1 glycerophosphodiester phosphodiesterase [Gimesia chilikensis]
MSLSPFIRQITGSLGSAWRPLVATDLLYKLLAFVILTPLLAGLFHFLLAIAGQSVLTDVDIALFFAGPFGWLCAIILGAVWLSIVALEQASLLAILAARHRGQQLGMLDSLRFAAGHAADVLKVTAKMIGWTLLSLVPFLLIAGVVYFGLLGEYDINFYLKERPTEFQVAVGIGVLLVLILAMILFRLYSGWFLALPLILFEQTPPAQGLQASQQLVSGQRRPILIWLVTWVICVLILNLVLVALVGLAGRFLIPTTVGSLLMLATRVGLMLFILSASSLILNLFATIACAGLLFQGYLRLHSAASAAIEASPLEVEQRGKPLLTPSRLAMVGIVGFLLAALIGYVSLERSLNLETETQVMAHRGASKAAPENTMAAFQAAIDEGADWIELDVQESADGKVVVIHDSDFMKLSRNPLKVWDAKQADLADIDIGSWLDPKFNAERVPLLSDVLQLCKDKAGVIIELKYYGHDEQLEQRVVDIVEAAGMADKVMIMSLKPEGVAKTKALRPDWKCGVLLSVYAGNLKEIQADFLAVNANFASRNFVKRAHAAGKEVFVWTVDDPAMMSQMMNRGVDGLLTNVPAVAKQVIQERESLTPAERLLVEVALLFQQPQAELEQ